MINSYNDREKFDQRHGGAFDRGMMDSYYGRRFEPHYYVGATLSSEKVTTLDEKQYSDYSSGFEWNEKFGDRKEWN